jgi:hypothetical protein
VTIQQELGHSPESETQHLRGTAGALPQIGHLQAELDRLAAQMQRLARTGNPMSHDEAATAALLRTLIRIRLARAKFLEGDLFADPAWDLLLELKLADLEQVRMSVSAACIAARVPATTALRWVNLMVDRGLLCRSPDKFDARRVFLSLAPTVSLAMDNFAHAAFEEIGFLELAG